MWRIRLCIRETPLLRLAVAFALLLFLEGGRREGPVNIQRELRALLTSGLRFSLEVKGADIRVWVGNYARRTTPDATFSSVRACDRLVAALRQLHRTCRRASASRPVGPGIVREPPSTRGLPRGPVKTRPCG